MRVRLGRIDVSDHVRKAIAAHVGKSGKCTRADIRALYQKAGDGALLDVVAEFDRRVEPQLPFREPDGLDAEASAT